MRGRTLRLLNMAITLSAPLFSTNCISTMTVGLALVSLQPIISPPTGVMTASISAAVVPGAKLLATTVQPEGCAAPRMLIPPAGLVGATWLYDALVDCSGRSSW